MSLLLTPNLLLQENTREIPMYFPIQESVFLSALKLVREVNDEMIHAKLELYTAIQEKEVDSSIAKSQKGFKSKVISVIMRLVNFIKDKIDQFVASMRKFFDKDEQLLKHKEETVKYFVSSKESFDMNIFEVANKMLDPNVPIVNPIIKIEMIDQILQMSQLIGGVYSSGKISEDEYEKSLKNMEERIIENKERCEEFRALLFGERESVSRTEYKDFIKKQLLDDEKSTKVDASRIMEAFDGLKKIKKLVEDISKSKVALSKNYDPIIQKIKLYNAVGPYQKDRGNNGGKDSTRFVMLLNRFFKEECETIIENINSQILAVSYKIDLLRTYHSQERRICSTAITKAKGTKEEAVAASALICDNNDILNEDVYGIYYDIFLIEEMNSRYDLQININQLLQEAGIDDLNTISVNEAGVLKAALDKLVAKIADMFGIFVRWFGEITKQDQEFLKNNKDIILKNAFKEETLRGTYPYKISELSTVEIPPLYYEQMKADLETEEAFVKKEFSEYASKMKEGVSFRDVVKSEMCGSAEKQDIPTNKYNVADVYNYCANFNGGNGTYASIKKEVSILQKSNNEIARFVKDIDTKTGGNAAGEQPVNASYSYITADEMLNEKALSSKDRKELDSSVFGLPDQKKYPMPDKQHVHSAITYFNKVDEKDEERLAKNIIKKIHKFHMEDEVRVTARNRFAKYYKQGLKEAEIGGENKDNASDNTNNNAAPNQQVNDADNDKKANDQVKDDVKKATDDGEDPKAVSNRIKIYFKVCGDYLGAKLTVARWAYLDYMKLLRWHAKAYGAGDKAKANTQQANTSDTGSDEPIDITGAAGEK